MKTENLQSVFTNYLFPPAHSHYLDSKALYMWHFNAIPSVCFIDQIDKDKAIEAFMEKYGDAASCLYQYRQFSDTQTTIPFNESVVVLKNRCIAVFYTQYCEILHPSEVEDFVTEVAVYLSGLKQKPEKGSKMNLIVGYGGYLD
jgi:hypothetical protein